jgi:hypothetical protein
MLLKIQLNHPGAQKPYRPGDGYREAGKYIIREWNNGKNGNHYRKFILNKGAYIDDLNDTKPKQTDLYFWGEWEGNSFFEPVDNSDYRVFPNGIHKSFHSTRIRGNRNTDPYVYGESFKYCTCKQTGHLCDLDQGSLILFGSVYPSLGKFYVDTVFVVGSNTPAVNIRNNYASGYSKTYREETLERLREYLRKPHEPSDKKLYHSQTWWENSEYFSFVPCKPEHDGKGFERLALDLKDPVLKLSSNPTGISELKKCELTPADLWRLIAAEAVQQGFKLGIRFEEPADSNVVDQGNVINRDNTLSC